MSYTEGGLIEAIDYNGFAATTAGANVNDIWATGATDRGYGQSALVGVAPGGVVTAAQWATLVNTISSISSHQGTTISARAAPTVGNIIVILAAINADLTNLTTNRGNAAASGSQFVSYTGTTAKTGTTGSGSAAWTLTFTHTITWASADAARYFFNAGGRIKWECAKTSTGTVADTDWNNLANTLVGDIYITGGTSTQTIAGEPYTGTTKEGGTGSPTVLLTPTGFYDLTTSNTTIYQQFADAAPYTGQFISIAARTATAGTQLILTTIWTDPGGSGPGSTDQISGGTNTTGITFGTAPATVVTYFPPSTVNLTNTWGVPTVVAQVATT